MEFSLKETRAPAPEIIKEPVVEYQLPAFNSERAWKKPTKILEVIDEGFDYDSISSLSAHIEKRRSLHDSLDDSVKDANLSINEIADLERQLRKMFETALHDISIRKYTLTQEVAKLQSEKQKNIRGINDENQLLSQLLSKQSSLEALKETEKKIREIVENFEAWKKARDYQQDAVLFSVNAYLTGLNGILNADDMSLGKTFETVVTDFIICILFEREHNRKPKCLWLTKKSLVKSNIREVLRWNPTRLMIPLSGGNPDQREFATMAALENNMMLVCNYEAVRTTPLIAQTEWDFVYIDEVHKLKGGANSGGPTAIWQAVRDVCRNSKFMIFMSGTPMVNKPEEMWSYLHIFKPEEFPNLKNFMKMYSDYKYNEQTKEVEVTVDAEKLIKLLRKQTIRRRRDEVGIQLPSFEIEHVLLEMGELQRKIYDQMRDYFFVWLDENEGKALTASVIIAQLTRLRQINTWCHGLEIKDPSDETKSLTLDCPESSKVDFAMDKIEELVAAHEPIVIFSAQFNGPLEEIYKRCKEMKIRVAAITGKNSDRASDFEVMMQNGELDVLLINMATGSEGLNLHKDASKWKGGARFGILLDRWWSPARNEQAWSRIHRPGAVDPVVVWFFHNESSVDQFMSAILEEKAALFHTIIEADALRPATDWRNMLKDLI